MIRFESDYLEGAHPRVLERRGQGPVKGAYLCSVPLGGELIELDIAPETL